MHKIFSAALGLMCLGLAASCNIIADEDGGASAVPHRPHAQGRDFATLDAYLDYLKSRGAMDIPYYEEMPDGRFRLIKRMRPGEQPQIFTRAELARMFGFSQ